MRWVVPRAGASQTPGAEGQTEGLACPPADADLTCGRCQESQLLGLHASQSWEKFPLLELQHRMFSESFDTNEHQGSSSAHMHNTAKHFIDLLISFALLSFYRAGL